ncbi:S-adenosyl-L-methionine-dependent methyltransferase [Eremomyces bilateralis CBS 781.70]|uniref:S-adenosyl-L-methionine-dependent methyltransferase n=1 Tax=Eremomyces bilateralis CBS 781.70 TaxID=1392243 RepID=A0A6G1G261_9PEZI|nr:S-adenosyl-L-methionine-dependent methyltransferase [Eremomyces bilateralis CBS 781.70]KAF1812195.1 S-adenosyl-L-methionine-dependent methyltransferase [Eremomyces bilateralis CBS 781.70]
MDGTQNSAPQTVEVDVDSDSALADDASTASTSLAESIFDYRRENGRSYHAYKPGSYVFPCDEKESDRLDLQHHLFQLTLDGKLFLAPVGPDPHHILDIGTGTGIWAIDVADEFPSCEVIGTDLAPTQPSFVPPNCKFIIDDAEDTWLFGSTKFDLVHFRVMGGCFKDWRQVFKHAFDACAPGGYIEVKDFILPMKCIDHTYAGTALEEWDRNMITASENFGKEICQVDSYKGWLLEAGFVDIQQRDFMWPSNPWPKDRKLKEIGKWNEVNITDGLEGFSLKLMTHGLGWSETSVQVHIAQVRSAIRDRGIHAYFSIPILWANLPQAVRHSYHGPYTPPVLELSVYNYDQMPNREV